MRTFWFASAFAFAGLPIGDFGVGEERMGAANGFVIVSGRERSLLELTFLKIVASQGRDAIGASRYYPIT